MSAVLGILHTADGQLTALRCAVGQKWHVFVVVSPRGSVAVRALKLPDPVAFAEKIDYPVGRALATFRRIGRKRGITSEAKKLLKKARSKP